MNNFIKDSNFLKKLDEYNFKVNYAKITLLDFNEKPLKEIQGIITNGNLNINGSSALRRVINITITTTPENLNITNLQNDFSLNKKIKIEIGYENPFKDYSFYGPILWFPCGIFLISQANIKKEINGCSISIQGKDKMVLLDGTVGGVFSSSVTFHESEVQNENGSYSIYKPTIFQIIQELVHHLGGEKLDNIIINDIPNIAKKMVKYIGDDPIYFAKDRQSFEYSSKEGYPYYCESGWDVGYQPTRFTYPGELIASAGNNITSILDKIKKILGNFEYFYDVNGKFIFQEKKNFQNINSNLLELQPKEYFSSYTTNTPKYNFKGLKTIISIAKNPKYDLIKNDFIVWGKRKGPTGIETNIRYHLAVDKKPVDRPLISVSKFNDCSLCHKNLVEILDNKDNILRYELYWDKINNNQLHSGEKIGKIIFSSLDKIFPKIIEITSEKDFLNIDQNILIKNSIIHYNNQYYWYQNGIKTLMSDDDLKPFQYKEKDENDVEVIKMKSFSNEDRFEWREELYRLALIHQFNEIPFGPYDRELLAEWRKIYDPNKSTWFMQKGWNPEINLNPSSLNYWLDFLDESSEIGEFSVNSIGRRTKVINDQNISSIYNRQVPDIIFLPNKIEDKNYQELIKYYKLINQPYIPLSETMYNNFSISSTKISAFDKIRELLYQHLFYNIQINISCTPKYYMEPNEILSLEDAQSGILGNYEISQMSLPLNYSGNMSITASKILKRV